MDTPFFDKIASLAQRPGRFHVPGHKGAADAIPAFSALLPFDLTEIAGADNLSCPAAELAQSEKNMAKVYGAGASLYSAGGSTSCVQAMLALFVGEGEQVVMGRNCHGSAVRALAFLGAEGEFLLPQAQGGISPEEADRALERTGAKALYVTSPDYEGRLCDIPALAAVCRRHGAKLLVDGAHGAHLVLFGLHPIDLGADAVAESAHKTLPALTPAAVLHLRDKGLAWQGRQALNLFTSTSPAYPVLCSLDWCAGLLQGAELADRYHWAASRMEQARRLAGPMAMQTGDPCKLTLIPPVAGYSTARAAALLRGEGVEPEMVTETAVVLMATAFNTEADFTALERALGRLPAKEPLPMPCPVYDTPPRGVSLRRAVLGKKEQLPTADAAGRVAAGIVAPCPPGIPVILPGEVFTQNIRESLIKSGILTVEVLL